MKEKLFTLLEENPVIAAVKDAEGLRRCCSCENIRIVFVLYGDLCTIQEIVATIKQADKIAIVHIDLITGFGSKDIIVDFMQRNTAVDGIISTKPGLARHAKEQGLYTVLRIFLLDSMAFQNIPKQLSIVQPDAIEILPGLMPKMLERVRRMAKLPVIAGGLISEKEDVMAALSAGAISVSTTNPQVWEL